MHRAVATGAGYEAARPGGRLTLYHRDGDAFVPTELTIGPWDPGLQHGGPPSALLTRALEAFGEDERYGLTRVSVDLLRPVPLVPVRTRVQPIRQGGRAWWLQAELLDENDRLLARATGLRLRREGQPAPRHIQPDPPPPGPETVGSFEFPFFPVPVAFHKAVDVRIVEGTWPTGPIVAWLRLLEPVVEGEPASPWQRTMALCDAINGVSPATGGTPGWSFINADLTVVARRPPVGEWLAIAARSIPDDDGVGLVQGALYDLDGEIGHVAESLVITGPG